VLGRLPTSSIDALVWLRKQTEEAAPDPLRAALTEMVNLLMAEEIDGVCGAGCAIGATAGRSLFPDHACRSGSTRCR